MNMSMPDLQMMLDEAMAQEGPEYLRQVKEFCENRLTALPATSGGAWDEIADDLIESAIVIALKQFDYSRVVDRILREIKNETRAIFVDHLNGLLGQKLSPKKQEEIGERFTNFLMDEIRSRVRRKKK